MLKKNGLKNLVLVVLLILEDLFGGESKGIFIFWSLCWFTLLFLRFLTTVCSRSRVIIMKFLWLFDP